jgi:hypothetical protein
MGGSGWVDQHISPTDCRSPAHSGEACPVAGTAATQRGSRSGHTLVRPTVVVPLIPVSLGEIGSASAGRPVVPVLLPNATRSTSQQRLFGARGKVLRPPAQ